MPEDPCRNFFNLPEPWYQSYKTFYDSHFKVWLRKLACFKFSLYTTLQACQNYKERMVLKPYNHLFKWYVWVLQKTSNPQRQTTTGFYDGNEHSYITRVADYSTVVEQLPHHPKVEGSSPAPRCRETKWWFECIFLHFKEKILLKNHQIKSNQSLDEKLSEYPWTASFCTRL